MGALKLTEGRTEEANIICLNSGHYRYHSPAIGLAGWIPYLLVPDEPTSAPTEK